MFRKAPIFALVSSALLAGCGNDDHQNPSLNIYDVLGTYVDEKILNDICSQLSCKVEGSDKALFSGEGITLIVEPSKGQISYVLQARSPENFALSEGDIERCAVSEGDTNELLIQHAGNLNKYHGQDMLAGYPVVASCLVDDDVSAYRSVGFKVPGGESMGILIDAILPEFPEVDPNPPQTHPCTNGSCLQDDGFSNPSLPMIPVEPAKPTVEKLIAERLGWNIDDIITVCKSGDVACAMVADVPVFKSDDNVALSPTLLNGQMIAEKQLPIASVEGDQFLASEGCIVEVISPEQVKVKTETTIEYGMAKGFAASDTIEVTACQIKKIGFDGTLKAFDVINTFPHADVMGDILVDQIINQPTSDSDAGLPDFALFSVKALNADELEINESGYLTGLVNGKNWLNQTAAAYIYIELDQTAPLYIYDFGWSIENLESSSHFVNIYLTKSINDGEKVTLTLLSDGTADAKLSDGTWIHYSNHQEALKQYRDWLVYPTYIDGPFNGKGNFVWRSSDSQNVVPGSRFTVKQYEARFANTVMPVVAPEQVINASDITVAEFTGAVIASAKGVDLLNRVAPLAVFAKVHDGYALKDYTFAIDIESDNNKKGFTNIYLVDMAGNKHRADLLSDGSVNFGNERFATYADFVNDHGDLKVTPTWVNAFFHGKGNFIYRHGGTNEVLVGERVIIKQFEASVK